MKLVNSRYAKDNNGIIHHRAMETRNLIYFISFPESKNKLSILIYNKKRELVSEGENAYNTFIEATDTENEHKIWWISDKLKDYISLKKKV